MECKTVAQKMIDVPKLFKTIARDFTFNPTDRGELEANALRVYLAFQLSFGEKIVVSNKAYGDIERGVLLQQSNPLIEFVIDKHFSMVTDSYEFICQFGLTVFGIIEVVYRGG